jgi:monoamine oxidase
VARHPSHDLDVIVVGAGVAGLATGLARRLRGARAVVMEARDRIGGRCYCDNSFPAPFDFGGQLFQQVVPHLLGGTNNPLYDLYITQGGVDVPCELIPDFCANGARLPDAEQAPFHDFALGVGAELGVVGAAIQLGASDVSADKATAIFAGQPWYILTTAVLGLLFNVPASHLSVLDFWNDAKLAFSLDGSATNKINPSGMGNFVAQFAQGVDIRLSTRVAAIDLSGSDRLTVTTDRGSLTSRAVIVAAPAAVLAAGGIVFRPGLPAVYEEAFADLPSGLVDKIGIAFRADIFGELPANTMVTRHQDQTTSQLGMGLARFAGQPMKNLFVANDLAHDLEAGGEAAFAAYAREFVSDTFGAAAAAAIERTIVHSWGADPFAMGSYSAARVGKVAGRRTLAEPIDNRLFFAGEATSTDSHSSLHGAYLTGQQAATSIAEHLGA